MHRRDLLRFLGSASIIVGLTPDDLLALGRDTHSRLTTGRSPIGFFDSHQMHTVAAAGERIMPATNTPGAMVAECHRFTELIVSERYDAARQRRFVLGLVDLDQRAARMHQRLFVDNTPVEQDAVLSAVESDAFDATDAMLPDIFWRDLKYLTLFGYYTSEVGIEQELQVNRFPGHFDGCAVIETVAK